MRFPGQFATFFLLFFLYANGLKAQCNDFARRECLSRLNAYVFDGQFNNTVLNQGEIAELALTFSKNQSYRIVVAGEENLGKLQFQFLDANYNIFYDNKNEGFNDFFDFVAEDTSNFIVRVIVPLGDNESKIESGCVTVLTGLKPIEDEVVFRR